MPFTRTQRATLAALCETCIPHLSSADTPGAAGALAADIERTLDAEPDLARRVALALGVLGHPLSVLIAVGRPRPFASLDPATRDAVLARWRDGRTAAARTVYQGLRRLVMSHHYAQPGALAGVGWLGPLHERSPVLPWEGPLHEATAAGGPVARAARDDAGDSRPLAASRAEALPGSVERGASHVGAVLRAGVCIVGSGAGGAVAAARLARVGHEVVLVEQGRHWLPSEFTEREGEMMPRLYARGGMQASADLALTVLQGVGLGGSGLVNWLVMLRTPEWVLDEWANEHGAESLTAAALAEVFARIELETGTCAVPDDAHSPANRLLLRGAAALGWRARRAAINAVGCVRAGTCGLGCRWNAKRGPATVYLPQALAVGARILTECGVRTIEPLAGGGYRVHCLASPADGNGGGRLTIEAPVVILAAGAVETPAILLRSGIGGDVVGRYLRLHPTTAVVGVHRGSVYAGAGIPISAVCDEFHRGDDGYGFWLECPPLYPAFASAALPGWGTSHRQRMVDFERLAPIISLVRDGAARGVSNGRVGIDRRGESRIEYRLGAADRRTLVRGVQAAASLQLAAGAEEAFSLHERAPAVRSADDVRRLSEADFSPNRFSLFSAHAMGSCRLGGDRRTSACDPAGQVWGAPGLYVVDGSVLPTAPAVNPQETIMAVADVLSGGIAARHPTG